MGSGAHRSQEGDALLGRSGAGHGLSYRNKTCQSRQARWDVFKLVLHQIYGIECSSTRTDGYFALCTDDETDFLFKFMRKEV